MLANYYCKTYKEAHKELQRRRLLVEGKGMIHRITKSPYRGYYVRSIDAEIYLDALDIGLFGSLSQDSLFGKNVI